MHYITQFIITGIHHASINSAGFIQSNPQWYFEYFKSDRRCFALNLTKKIKRLYKALKVLKEKENTFTIMLF